MSSHGASLPDDAQIPQFYSGRSVFITGATGFMGKVLVERLLSTCSDIGRLYLLMRTKKEVGPDKRLVQLKDSLVFDVLRKTNPSQLDKLVAVPGDTSLLQLGMSIESLALLQEVSVVFHSAATVKFNEVLPKAVDQNLRSVMRLMDICDQLPNMEAFVYVSTAFSNAEHKNIEEKVYPPPVPLDELLALVGNVPAHILEDITDKYISPKPNTYTFTKAMAESAVERHGAARYGVAVFRPSAVVSAVRHPHPGWIENLNGPGGALVNVGNGVLRVFGARPSGRADVLPVDVAIDTLIAVAWEVAVDRPQDVKVYNCSTHENPITWGTLRTGVVGEMRKFPMKNVLWYPFLVITGNRFVEKSLHMMLHTLPFYMAEYVTRLLGVKKQISFITMNKKLHAMIEVMRYFSLNEWSFENANVQRLRERLSKEDRNIYNLDSRKINWKEHNSNFAKGMRRYMMKQNDDQIPEARHHLQRMKYLHYAVTLMIMMLPFGILLQIRTVRSRMCGLLRLLMSLYNAASSHIAP